MEWKDIKKYLYNKRVNNEDHVESKRRRQRNDDDDNTPQECQISL